MKVISTATPVPVVTVFPVVNMVILLLLAGQPIPEKKSGITFSHQFALSTYSRKFSGLYTSQTQGFF
jgi:hypothetical protein